jgi:hypothetical protein
MPALGSLNHDPSLAVGTSHLCVEPLPDGVRIKLAHPPGLLCLFREAMLPVIGALAALVIAALGVYLFHAGDGQWRAQAIISLVVAGIILVAAAFETFRNCGIVIEISIENSADGAFLIWRRANLWGGHTFRWPVASIKRAHAHNWCIRWGMRRHFTALTIDRKDGRWPLRAFTRQPMEEIRTAACALNRALGQHE